MEAYKQEFIEFMVDCEVLKFGSFVTKSGRNTPFFVNTGFYRTGAQLRRLGGYYARAIKEKFGLDFDVLFGPAYKGIPLTVAATSAISELYNTDIRYCSNRKEVKDHGDKGILLGHGRQQLFCVFIFRNKFGHFCRKFICKAHYNKEFPLYLRERIDHSC